MQLFIDIKISYKLNKPSINSISLVKQNDKKIIIYFYNKNKGMAGKLGYI